VNNKKILIVDNDKNIVYSIVDKLKQSNCFASILVAYNYKDAVKHIIENKNDIRVSVVSLNLPDVKSGQMAEYTIQKQIPTIIFTSEFDAEIEKRFLQKDILDYVSKTSKNSIKQIVHTVKRIIHNSNINVLIAEDSKMQANFLKQILEYINLNVLIANDGIEALEILKNNDNKISLLLTDYRMPNMDGKELVINSRDIFGYDELGIIVLSSSDKNDISTQFIKLGANDYIEKPYIKNAVVYRVNSLLDNLEHFENDRIQKKQMKNYIDLIDKNVIISSTDLNSVITDVSEAFCKISGYTKNELIGKKQQILKHPDMIEDKYKELWETISNNKVWQGEIKNKKKDGGYYWVNAIISPIFNDQGVKIGYTAIRQDITDKKIIEEISITDGLTNIYNRRYFNEMFPKTINSSKRGNSLVSFIIMDIDHFKQYNDTYGHQMGDNLLIKVANVIKNSLHRADDYCFRLGGEEFGVLCKIESKQKAFEFANKIRQNIENLHIEHEKNSASAYITMSMGLVSLNAKDIHSADKMYKMADDLLYKAKENGRNKVVDV